MLAYIEILPASTNPVQKQQAEREWLLPLTPIRNPLIVVFCGNSAWKSRDTEFGGALLSAKVESTNPNSKESRR